MGAIFDDLKAAAGDAWNGNDMLGDMAATGLDSLDAATGGTGMLPNGKDAKEAIEGVESDYGMQKKQEGNLGNEIGTVAGGVLGLAGGPLGAVAGMDAGSKLGGFISDMF
jgi:hypothetical protein